MVFGVVSGYSDYPRVAGLHRLTSEKLIDGKGYDNLVKWYLTLQENFDH